MLNLPTSSKTPPSDPIKPTKKDYERGFFKRKFAVKRKSGSLTETSQGFRNNQIYDTFEVKWKLTGPLNDEINDAGFPVRTGVFDTNTRQIQRYEEKYPGFADLVTNPLKFWEDDL